VNALKIVNVLKISWWHGEEDSLGKNESVWDSRCP
jgi:hypothetical protein